MSVSEVIQDMCSDLSEAVAAYRRAKREYAEADAAVVELPADHPGYSHAWEARDKAYKRGLWHQQDAIVWSSAITALCLSQMGDDRV